MPVHSFDQAIALRREGAGRFSGQTSPAYWNMVGPFGGVSAAVALHAVLLHLERLGEPVALTVNYASGMAQGPYEVVAHAARTNRSTQHWMVEVLQSNAQGARETVLTATAITALRRDTWGASDVPMPVLPLPRDVPLQTSLPPQDWFNRYEMRFAAGAMPAVADGTVRQDDPRTDSLTQVWMRDAPPRKLDFCSLAAFADLFYPRLFLRRARRVPVGTVSMTVYFHAMGAELADCGEGYLLGQARGQVYHQGFFDQKVQLWSASGRLLATSLQIVYYKE